MHLHIKLHYSRLLCAFLFFIYGGAIVCLWLSPFAWWVKISGTLFCGGFGINALLRQALLQSNHAIIHIRKTTDQWVLQQKNGELFSGSFCGSSFISSYLLILNFRATDSKTRFAILMAKDSFQNKDDLRKFRASLLL